MLELLWLIPAFPLASFLVLVLVGARIPRSAVGALGVGSIGLSAVVVLLLAFVFVSSPPQGNAYTQTLWTWIHLSGFTPQAALYLDPLSLVMVLVITIVGFLIHLYSVAYMADDEGYSRFFAYMNLFVGAMLILVLADNLLLLYLGWEGVGLCSYLLIGFWYKEAANARAAIKAFIMTRVGDTGMLVGILLLFSTLGTVQIQELMQRASQEWAVGSTLAVLAAGLLLAGAVGKSAQLPLQAWLPDAMAGPTPVSALIHAATMVTAGVYLIARTNALFALAPVVQWLVALIGVATLLIASFSALAQSDIKRVLAYSTISQIGYMFLALGVGAWSTAVFHFATHAFFKALLFLAAGSVIMAAHHEQDMFKLGGLARQMPVTFWTFLVGAASLAALPLVTSGFYSKELILREVWSSDHGGFWLWMGGIVGAMLTGVYAFRMVFVTFFGNPRVTVDREPGLLIKIPLIILAVFSLGVGFVEVPRNLGDIQILSNFLEKALPRVSGVAGTRSTEWTLQVLGGAACLVGPFIAYLFFLRFRGAGVAIENSPLGAMLHRLWFSGWGFDWLYDRVFVRPFFWITHVNRNDVVDLIYSVTALLTEMLHHGLSFTQTGKVRQYALGIAIGAVLTIAVAVFL